MTCACSMDDLNELTKKVSSVVSIKSDKEDDNRIFLPRGGWLVETSEGNV